MLKNNAGIIFPLWCFLGETKKLLKFYAKVAQIRLQDLTELRNKSREWFFHAKKICMRAEHYSAKIMLTMRTWSRMFSTLQELNFFQNRKIIQTARSATRHRAFFVSFVFKNISVLKMLSHPNSNPEQEEEEGGWTLIIIIISINCMIYNLWPTKSPEMRSHKPNPSVSGTALFPPFWGGFPTHFLTHCKVDNDNYTLLTKNKISVIWLKEPGIPRTLKRLHHTPLNNWEH